MIQQKFSPKIRQGKVVKRKFSIYIHMNRTQKTVHDNMAFLEVIARSSGDSIGIMTCYAYNVWNLCWEMLWNVWINQIVFDFVGFSTWTYMSFWNEIMTAQTRV